MGQVRDDRFKVRAVVLGSFFVVLVSVWATYSEFIVRASRLNMSNFALALFVPFVPVSYTHLTLPTKRIV